MASAKQAREHGEIRRWADDRGGIPIIVEGTRGLLRIDSAAKVQRLERALEECRDE